MRRYDYLGHRNHWNDKDDFSDYDQNKCIFQPKLEEYLAETILDNFQIDNLQRVGITKEMILDAFKLFYYKDKEVAVSPKMYWFHHYLSKCDNHILNMVTSDSPGFSYIASNAVVETLYKFLAKNNPDLDELNEAIKNGGSPDLDKLSKAAKTGINRAKRDIQKTQDAANKFGCSKDFGKDLKSAQILCDTKLLNSLSLNSNSLSKFVKFVVDKAVSYSTGKRYTVEESIFDSDDIEDISNVECFSHFALINELSVVENRYVMNFDIFIDDSGSMGCNYDLGGRRIELRNLARMIAFKMHAMKMVKDIWLFSSRDELFKIDISQLFISKIDGGTDISQCIKESNKSGRPCLIITDGNDHLDEKLKYNDKAYMLALEMSHGLDKSWKEYADNKQILFYDSHKGFREGIYTKNSGDWCSIKPVN